MERAGWGSLQGKSYELRRKVAGVQSQTKGMSEAHTEQEQIPPSLLAD